MKRFAPIIAVTLLAFAASGVQAQFGQPFYGDAPDDHHPWAVHDQNRPQPKIIVPGTFSSEHLGPKGEAGTVHSGPQLGRPGPAGWLIRGTAALMA